MSWPPAAQRSDASRKFTPEPAAGRTWSTAPTSPPASTPRRLATAFTRTTDADQRTAGIIAARARGDLDGAERLLASMDDHIRAAGSLFLADLAIALLAQADGRPVDQVASELSLHVAALGPQIPS